MASDPRLTPARADLAAAHLRETVAARRYAEGESCVVIAPLADLFASPGDAALASQLLPLLGFAIGLPILGVLAFNWIERAVRVRGELDLY